MAKLYGNSTTSTTPNQREYRAKTQAYLLKGKLTADEIIFLEIERRRLDLSPDEANAIAAEVKRSARQAKAARWGMLSIFLLGLGTMSLLLQQAPVSSRQAHPSVKQSETSRVVPNTFTSQEQGGDTLAKARQIVEQKGDFDVAIATATQIPNNSLLYPEAQIQILQWQQQKWEDQNDAYQRMKQASVEKNWQTVLDIATTEIPQTQYWLNRQGVLKMLSEAKVELLKVEKS